MAILLALAVSIAVLVLHAARVRCGPVLFAEDFEAPDVATVIRRWDHARHPENMALSSDVPPGSSGRHSLRIVRGAGVDGGGHLYTLLPGGHDSLYARFDVKFSAAHAPVHHFVTVGGYAPPTRWPQGGAGTRPDGTDRFSVAIEPHGRHWQWDAYAYWTGMHDEPGQPAFGNRLAPEPPVPVRRGEWVRVEMLLRLNEPVSEENGGLTLWIDGRRCLDLGPGGTAASWSGTTLHADPVATEGDDRPFAGFRWRSDPALRINFFWLLYYMTDVSAAPADTVWFDDVLVAARRPVPRD